MERDLRRTKTDADRVEHLAEADGAAAHVVNVDVGIRPWIGGTVTSAVQVQVLGDELSPAEALRHGGLDAREDTGAEQHERDPQQIRRE